MTPQEIETLLKGLKWQLCFLREFLIEDSEKTGVAWARYTGKSMAGAGRGWI